MVSRNGSRAAIAEWYATQAAEAEHRGQHRRAAKLYKMALLTLLGDREASPDGFVQNGLTEADLPDEDAHMSPASGQMHPDGRRPESN